MQALTDNVNKTPDASPVLTKSVTRAADYLGISRTNMTKILGLSPASISRYLITDISKFPKDLFL